MRWVGELKFYREKIKPFFLGKFFQICEPTEIRVKKGDFRGDLGGFGPGLGISHPTHPYLGKISKKNRFYFLGASLKLMLGQPG